MSEGMEPSPLDARLRACRGEHALGQVVRIEDRSDLALEGELAGSTATDMNAQALGKLDRDRQVAPGVPRLQWSNDEALPLATSHALTHLDERPRPVELEMSDLEREKLRAPDTGPSEQLE